MDKDENRLGTGPRPRNVGPIKEYYGPAPRPRPGRLNQIRATGQGTTTGWLWCKEAGVTVEATPENRALLLRYHVKLAKRPGRVKGDPTIWKTKPRNATWIKGSLLDVEQAEIYQWTKR